MKIRLPHHGVYTRLKQSKIHGVGVFAIKTIPKGINIFPDTDEGEVVAVPRDAIENADPEIKSLYNDFCPIQGDIFWCPKNFNSLTVGWFINESKNPNVRYSNKNDSFYALREIVKGEELTADYMTYSEEDKRLK